MSWPVLSQDLAHIHTRETETCCQQSSWYKTPKEQKSIRCPKSCPFTSQPSSWWSHQVLTALCHPAGGTKVSPFHWKCRSALCLVLLSSQPEARSIVLQTKALFIFFLLAVQLRLITHRYFPELEAWADGSAIILFSRHPTLFLNHILPYRLELSW